MTEDIGKRLKELEDRLDRLEHPKCNVMPSQSNPLPVSGLNWAFCSRCNKWVTIGHMCVSCTSQV
jgi:hypothetical protein